MTPGLRSRAVVLLVLHVGIAPAIALAGEKSAPVFYQRHPSNAARAGDELELLRRGLVRVQHYPPADASEFNWERDSFTDYTWWMQMQELRFLLPAIESPDPDDQRLARAWFMRWYAVHMVPEPALTHWGEPMTVGYRAMVLVRLLKAEERRTSADPAVIDAIRSSILAHQRDLARSQRFNEHSNHGFIAALGLFETTRVAADSAVAALALMRVEAMMKRAVSAVGVEKEHSPAYHFVVLDWLEQMEDYFATLPGRPRHFAPKITATASRMRRAGYFLYDHAGRLPPIGDTDSLRVDADASGDGVIHEGGARTLYDPEAGFAIYKGIPGGRDCRYVVFRIPGEHVEMPSHCHHDALAVFFSHAGETILGDSGRYSYSSSATRRFMQSARAHNTLVAYPLALEPGTAVRPPGTVSELAGPPGPGWSGSTHIGSTAWSRSLRVLESDNAIRVVDSLQPGPGAGGEASVVVLWHLGSDVIDVVPGRVKAGGTCDWTLGTRQGQRIRLTLKAAGPGRAGIVDAFPVRGNNEPFLGWYSPGPGILNPVTTLVIRMRRDPTVSLTTEVTVEEGACAGPRAGSGGR